MTSTDASLASKPDRTISTAGIPGKWWVLIAVGVGAFMSALDVSVVNIILPVLTRDLGSDIATIEWVATIYLLVVSGLLLTLGRLGDMRGHKTIYATGFVIFVTASVLCGLAPTAVALIGFRALQALGAAMLFANSPAIVTMHFPSSQRGQALGLQSMMTYLGLTVAPSLGGWLTQQFGWRTVFYVNVPIGMLGLALCLIFIPRDAPSGRRESFDIPGAVVFMAGFVLLLLGLNQGHAWGWGSLATLAVLLVGGLLLAAFVFIESRVAAPMLDLRLFRSRLFSAAVGSAVLNYVCVYSVLFLLPFYLIQGRGLNPAQAGLVLTAEPLVMAVVTPLSGSLSDRIGSRLLATLGLSILAVGVFLLTFIGPQTPLIAVAGILAVAGLGIGIFISPNSSALMGSAPPGQQGIAAGILATARNVGMVLGIGLVGAIFTTGLADVSPGDTAAALFDAMRLAFLVVTAVAILGAVVSAIRGNRIRPASSVSTS